MTMTDMITMQSSPDWAIKKALLAILAVFTLAICFAGVAAAHPEDEFCLPGGEIDPALCRALQEIDRAGPVIRTTPDGTVLPELDLDRPWQDTLGLYVKIGVDHILPGGTDHILFVLALVLSTRRLKSLALQISAFTLAHTLTLGLAATGVISPAASVVEPLIALTIALVAIEVIFFKEPPRWRLPVVVLFGLIHGMGFAGFFSSLGLPQGQFLSALAGFNIGVEIGQLVVAAVAGVVLWFARKALSGVEREAYFRPGIIIPASLGVSAIGALWFVERVAGV
ncbi:MAG: HupE/UreJ family protein [Pseudomonadota bacterium]